MSNKAWMYKGKESKIFAEEELKEAMLKGWVDNPEEANRSPEELAADLAVLEEAKRAALKEAQRMIKEEEEAQKEEEEAQFEAELQKEKETATSGASTFQQ